MKKNRELSGEFRDIVASMKLSGEFRDIVASMKKNCRVFETANVEASGLSLVEPLFEKMQTCKWNGDNDAFKITKDQMWLLKHPLKGLVRNYNPVIKSQKSLSVKGFSLIHIGKAGGSSLRTALIKNTWVRSAKENEALYFTRVIHRAKMDFSHLLLRDRLSKLGIHNVGRYDTRTANAALRYPWRRGIEQNSFASHVYVICMRNPVDRYISAFYFHKHCGNEVLREAKQINAFFIKYPRVGDLIDKLESPSLQKDPGYLNLCHIHDDTHFYLKEFLQLCSPEDIHGVITQEGFSEDLRSLFPDVEPVFRG